MNKIRAFFRRHPSIHGVVHWFAFMLGGLLEVQDKILGASALFPEGSKVPHYVGWGFGVVAFSNIFVGKVEKVVDPAAPTGAIPTSEAITTVTKKPDADLSK